MQRLNNFEIEAEFLLHAISNLNIIKYEWKMEIVLYFNTKYLQILLHKNQKI